MNEELVVVYVASGQTQAQIVKGKLESEGIPVFCDQEALGKIYGLSVLSEVRIRVPMFCRNKALEILSSIKNG